MSGCNSLSCLAVQSLVKEWMNAHQPVVAWSVFEDQKTIDISIHVLLPGNPQQRVLKGQQVNNILDSGIEAEIRGWLANLPYPNSASAG